MSNEVQNHPLNFDIRKKEDIENGTPSVTVRIVVLGESSVSVRAWAWASDMQSALIMEYDFLELIKKGFDKERTVIPFPQRTFSYLDGKNGI